MNENKTKRTRNGRTPVSAPAPKTSRADERPLAARLPHDIVRALAHVAMEGPEALASAEVARWLRAGVAHAAEKWASKPAAEALALATILGEPPLLLEAKNGRIVLEQIGQACKRLRTIVEDRALNGTLDDEQVADLEAASAIDRVGAELARIKRVERLALAAAAAEEMEAPLASSSDVGVATSNEISAVG